MKKQTGKLTVVAKTAGLKMEIEGEETKWINPTKEAKEDALPRLDTLRGNMGKNIELTLTEEGLWSELKVVAEDEASQKKEDVEEESDDGKKEDTGPDALPELPREKAGPIPDPFKIMMAGMCEMNQECTDKGYFKKLKAIQGDTKKLGHHDLTYMSWAEAWDKLKEQYPDASYHVHEAGNGMPYFYDSTGGFAKVSVTVCGMTHTVHLPIMDHMNKSITPSEMTTFDINKNIQRALTKAIAMHGMGLYVYKGEDLPEKSGVK